MAIVSAPIDPHWNYLLALDSDLVVLSRFVEFTKPNYKAYSLEMARILLAAAAEVDVVCKQLCLKVSAASRAETIGDYRKELRSGVPGLVKYKVTIPRFGLTLQPWSNWKKGQQNPDWWRAYNDVKHHRHTRYPEANLQNCLNAVAGLYVALLYLFSDRASVGGLVPDPRLLRPERAYSYGVAAGSPDGGIVYRLP